VSLNPSPAHTLPAHPSLEQQRKRARELLNAVRAKDPEALRRFSATLPRLAGQTAAAVAAATRSLHEAQLVIAREAGFSSWPKLKAHIESVSVTRALERYTDRARRALFFSRQEAAELGSRSIEPEHILLALLREGHVVNRIFARSALTPEGIRKGIEDRTGPREKILGAVEIPFSLETKRVLQGAADEADRLSHHEITTEHLLLAILQGRRSLVSAILATSGIQPLALRAELLKTLDMTPVGSTARWVAASRALETESANPLFSDPFARELAGDAGFALLTSLWTGVTPTSGTVPEPYFVIRTRFLDDALLAAVRASSFTQVVVLAAGLDTRAFRLGWPEGLVLFEVDRHDVFNHKETVLKRLKAQPRCERRIVRADFSQPWTDAILSAGFDSSRPAAILAEGFLPYLDESVVARLFETIGSLAREGSWLGLDTINAEWLVSPWPFYQTYLKKLAELGCPWVFGVNDPEQFLAQYGWTGTIAQPGEPEANYGRWPHAAVPRAYPTVPRTYLVTASRTGVERGTRSSA
jgi:methyltransferase (TIGR00027 family)